MSGSFDVFLSYNSNDRPAVRQLAQALQHRGLHVWLDEEQLQPGLPWQDALEEIIQTTNSAAVLVGKDGLGPWEIPEMRSFLLEFVNRKLPVIPVLLPNGPDQPKLPLLLKQFTWVDLRGGLTKDGLDKLEWGITGVRPGQLIGGAKGSFNRLQKKISELRLICTECDQKMTNLRRDLISATHSHDERLKIQGLINATNAECEQFEQKLAELESQLESLSVTYVVLVEFTLDQPLESFDQNEFKDAFKKSIGVDASKARIVSIHQASILVRFKADGPEEGLILDNIVDALAPSSKEKVSESLIKFTASRKSSKERVSESLIKFAALTKMIMMTWINRGKQYELQLRDDLKTVTIREKHDPDPDPYKIYIEPKY